jgi:hypothetical protein
VDGIALLQTHLNKFAYEVFGRMPCLQCICNLVRRSTINLHFLGTNFMILELLSQA